MTTEHTARESWLNAGIVALRPLIEAQGHTVPDLMRVACAFPIGSSKFIGECISNKLAADGSWTITICPSLNNPITVLATLLHEMCHATLGLKVGHKAPFAKLVKALGLEGPARATKAEEGTPLYCTLSDIADSLGVYPHEPVQRPPRQSKSAGARKSNKVTIRSLVEPSYSFTIPRKLLDEAGAPRCPWESVMVVVEDTPAEQSSADDTPAADANKAAEGDAEEGTGE